MCYRSQCLGFKCAACFVHVSGQFSVVWELICLTQRKSGDIGRAAGDFQAGGGYALSAAVALLHASVTEFQLNGHTVDADVMEDVPDLLMELSDSAERTVELDGDSHVHRGHVSTLRQLPQVSVVDTQDPRKAAHVMHWGCESKEGTLVLLQQQQKNVLFP